MALDRRRLISIVAGAAAVGGLIWLQRLDQTPQFVTVPTDAPGPPLPSPFLTAQLFHPGTRLRLNLGETAVAATEDAGVLDLPTGQLIAVDPSWLYRGPRPDTVPFTVSAPPGHYPLTLGLAVGPRSTGTLVAAAKLTIRDEPVATWEMALRPGEDTATLPPNHFFGVGVDVATIVLFDAVELPEMVSLTNAGSTAFDLVDQRHTTGSVELSQANTIAFQTGLGDGGYPVWIGRTGDGSVAAYMVDMLVLAPS